ncbi:MAG: hypothetical protein AB7O66_21140 [Limisphaerales bacterium]
MRVRSSIFPLGLLLVVVLGAVLLKEYRRSNGPRVELPDGSSIHVWKTSFGTNHELVLGKLPGLDNLRLRFPWVARIVGPTTDRVREGRTGNGMCVFHSWEDGMGLPKVNPPWVRAAYDEHGCRLEFSQGRGESSVRGLSIAHQFSALYPRRLAEFELEMSGTDAQGTGVVRIPVRNPHPWKGIPWVPEALPAVREIDDGLRVTFLGFEGSDRWPRPRFRVEQGGEVRPEWKPGRVLFQDVTGNESQTPNLCRHENAWRIEASFEREPGFGFGPDEAATLSTDEFPGLGELTELSGRQTLQGVTVGWIAMGGPGRFEFERRGGAWVATRADPLRNTDRGDGSSSGSGPNGTWMKLTRTKRWWMVDLQGLAPDLTWKLVGRDTAGKVHVNAGWSGSGSVYTVVLDVPEDAKLSRVQLVIQRWRTVAFTVAPPKIPTP